MDENELIEVSQVDAKTFLLNPTQYITGHQKFGYSYSKFDNTCYFSKARIKDNLTLFNINVTSNIVIQDSYIDEITIDNFNVNEGLFQLTISNSKINNIYISRTKLHGLHLSMLDTQKVMIFTGVSIKNLHLNEILKGTISLSNIESDLIEITNSVVEKVIISKVKNEMFNLGRITSKQVLIKSSEIKELKIRQCTIGNLNLSRNRIEDVTKIINKTKIGHFEINEKDLKRINIENSYIQYFDWKHDKLCLVNINESEIECLNFIKSLIFKDSIFQVINSNIRTLYFALFINNGTLFFSGINRLNSYKRLQTEQVVLAGDSPSFKYISTTVDGLFRDRIEQFDFVIENGKTDGSIYMINSDMGKTSFVKCYFEDFKNFYFNNSKILDVFVADTKFKLEIDLLDDENKFSLYEQKRLAYGQFKKIYENRGDNVTSTEYLALELEIYRKHLKEQKIRCDERANLWLNSISSNYGNNWVRAIIVTIGITLFCFWLYCMTSGYGIGTDTDKMFDLLSYSPEYLNPLRKADFLKDSQGNYLIVPRYDGYKGLARFWDYLSRIIIAYFVYQTIQAFRRFGKTK